MTVYVGSVDTPWPRIKREFSRSPHFVCEIGFSIGVSDVTEMEFRYYGGIMLA